MRNVFESGAALLTITSAPTGVSLGYSCSGMSRFAWLLLTKFHQAVDTRPDSASHERDSPNEKESKEAPVSRGVWVPGNGG
jgi:hypothetical protein